MNLLLCAINAKYIHSNLAVYSLKGSAGKYEPMVELAEYTINHQPEEIFRSVYQKQPDILFLSCYIWNRSILTELAENLRKVLPKLVIWAGGPEVSYDARQFLEKYPQFDGVMTGEGEHSFSQLLEHYVDNTLPLSGILGITYRQMDGSIISNGPALMMDTLDELPFVYQKPEEFEHKIIYYESSRGCPFSCSYCLSSIDKRVRFRSLELVKRELAFFLEHRVPQVKFVDRTFNCRHAHAIEIWTFLRDHDNGVTNFHFEISADLLNEEELILLSQLRPGLVQLEIGVQTVNKKALEAIHRTADFAEIAQRVERIAQSHNIHQHLDLIAGLPYEDYESFQDSFDTVYRLHPQELQLGFLKVLKGSELYQRAEEYGIVYRSREPYEVLQTKWITCDELLRLKEIEEMLEVYYNSQQFRNTILALEEQFPRPFALYEALADYYKAHQLTGKSYSRMQRFEILRSFIHEALPQGINHPDTEHAASSEYLVQHTGKADMSDLPVQEAIHRMEELLTLDCYLRENAKTRPAWAEEQGPYHDTIARFYQEEARQPRYLPNHQAMTWKQTMRMTHLEHFTHDPLTTGTSGEYWLLFDYTRRDPLTGDAFTQILDL